MINDIEIPVERIQDKILIVRNRKILSDADLAKLYGVETRVLKQAVRRNKTRFPADFMFELKKKEPDNLRSQFGTSSWGGTRYLPIAFTKQRGLSLTLTLLAPYSPPIDELEAKWFFVNSVRSRCPLWFLLAGREETTEGAQRICKGRREWSSPSRSYSLIVYTRNSMLRWSCLTFCQTMPFNQQE